MIPRSRSHARTHGGRVAVSSRLASHVLQLSPIGVAPNLLETQRGPHQRMSNSVETAACDTQVCHPPAQLLVDCNNQILRICNIEHHDYTDAALVVL